MGWPFTARVPYSFRMREGLKVEVSTLAVGVEKRACSSLSRP